MKKMLFITVWMFGLTTIKAQSDSANKKLKPLIASVKTMNQKQIKGRLSSISDSGLTLNSFYDPQIIPPENIKSFTLKRKNSALRGALIGFGVGAITGVIIGFASGDDPTTTTSFDLLGYPLTYTSSGLTAGQKAATAGTLMGITGGITGAIIGALVKKKFIIGGKKQKFHDLQSEVMMKLVKK